MEDMHDTSPPDLSQTQVTDLGATAMGEPSEPSQPKTWLQKIWGIVLFLILLGTVVGLPLWWVWAKSPFNLIIKVVITLIPIVLVILIV